MRVAGTYSSQTVCQIPVVRGYQIECGWSCQSCLPRGLARSCGSSSARTTISHSRPVGEIRHVHAEGRIATVMSARKRAVDPDRRLPVDGAEVENPAPAPAGISGSSHCWRYQHVRKKSVRPMPLAGASGAKGTRMRLSQRASVGYCQTPSGSNAKSQSPFSENQVARWRRGRGYPRPSESSSVGRNWCERHRRHLLRLASRAPRLHGASREASLVPGRI